MNLKAFFDAIRGGFTGTLEPGEVAGTEQVLNAMKGQPIAWVAYALATAFHETNGTLQPIREFGSTSYFTAKYDIKGANPPLARRLGNLQPGDGAKFCGRGLPQTTGRTNYEKASKFFGRDCIADPDILLEPHCAAEWMNHAMTEGLFTGKRFASYLPARGVATAGQFTSARRIINGSDRADTIAAYAVAYQAALQKAGWA